MTNIEKAKEIQNESEYYILMSKSGAALWAAKRMAEWKDAQFAEEKKELIGLVNMLPVNENNKTIIEDLKALLS